LKALKRVGVVFYIMYSVRRGEGRGSITWENEWRIRHGRHSRAQSSWCSGVKLQICFSCMFCEISQSSSE